MTKPHVLRKVYHKLKIYAKVNWLKTIYFNYKLFPRSVAKHLPVFFYGKVKFQDLSGKVIINGTIRRGMIGFGQDFEARKRYKELGEISVAGTLVFNGAVHFGKDVFLWIGKDAYCEFGYMSSLGSEVKLVCTNKITIGDWSGIAFESQVMDTNFHPMLNTETGELYPLNGPISIGSHNTISNRVSILANTKTPDFCTVASNSLCGKDYSELGANILLGGVPAKLLRNNYSRDWKGEKELLKQYKVII